MNYLAQILLKSLGVNHSQPMCLFCDNQVALHIAANSIFYERKKYIEIDFHYVCDQIQLGQVSTFHIRTTAQLVDTFTKALCNQQFQTLKSDNTDLHAPT